MKIQPPRRSQGWGIYPTLGLLPLLAILAASAAFAAYTEPRLALTRIQALHGSAAVTTLQLEGTFSFADLVQLGIPTNVYVVQGALTARFDQAGAVYTSTSGGAEQQVSGPGLVSFTANRIAVVLPPGFTAGPASVRVVITYEGKELSTNQLGTTL